MKASRWDLCGQTALVTGGNTGIGLGMALGLARAGVRVAVLGRDERKNDQALQALQTERSGCRVYSYDLIDADGLLDLYQGVSQEMGGIDILVNNAGIQCRGRADEIALADFNRVIAVNLTAPYVLSQCFARERIALSKGGSIILTASLMSEAARKTTSAYTASKGGIRQLVRALAVDWAEFGIRVNGIGPGYIRTEMTRPLYEDEAFDSWVKQRTPLGRWGEPDDFAGAVVFLASEAARFITGQILYIDGGWLATF
ncbi:SDR family oxidoreductase [candidate division KSB1 bacterium]|nr:SDR family oxidoreductase [candidate division KSB1 bacterium]